MSNIDEIESHYKIGTREIKAFCQDCDTEVVFRQVRYFPHKKKEKDSYICPVCHKELTLEEIKHLLDEG